MHTYSIDFFSKDFSLKKFNSFFFSLAFSLYILVQWIWCEGYEINSYWVERINEKKKWVDPPQGWTSHCLTYLFSPGPHQIYPPQPEIILGSDEEDSGQQPRSDLWTQQKLSLLLQLPTGGTHWWACSVAGGRQGIVFFMKENVFSIN